MNPVEVEVTADFVCPWCWIGHRNLEESIRAGGLDKSAIRVRFVPFELNPDAPKAGISRYVYRTRKFGSWARSQALDAEVTAAGRRVGAEFRYDRVSLTSNTRLAHRLMYWAQQQGDDAALEALPEALFSAYFSDGRNIGSVDVLTDLAASVGFDADAVRSFLSTDAGEHEVIALEAQAQVDGVHSVPSIRIAGQRISGAQSPAVMARALTAGMAVPIA